MGDTRLAAAAERALGKGMASLPVSLRERANLDPATALPGHQRLACPSREPLHAAHRAGCGVARSQAEILLLAARPRACRAQVDPLGLVAKGSTWYLVAHTAHGFRTYRVSRMEEAEVLDVPSNARPTSI